MDYLEVDYPSLVRDPAAIMPRLIDFLGEARVPTAEKMATVIDPSLHRKKNISS